ncbi:MAG TPA: hypothetical protein VEJ67_10200 [Candidatus Cybelea sp.]|nr:hypothetical protein [Candidatus Cybelea sp.]
MKPSLAVSVSLLVAVLAAFLALDARQLLAQAQLPAAEPNELRTKTDKKELAREIKQLVGEGKALEQQGKLTEARDKYVDAEGILSSADTLSAIAQIDEQQKQRVGTFLSGARRSYDAGQFSNSNQLLRQGLDIEPSDAALHFDLSLGYLKLGDRGNAAQHLDLAANAVSGEKERTRLLELLSAVLIGTHTPGDAADAKENPAASTFNKTYLEEDRDPGNTPAPAAGSLCDQTRALEGALAADPAIVFNSAKCAAEDARPQDAASLLANYAKLAPDALDRADAARFAEDLYSLASLPGDAGQAVRQHYATAARYLDYRRYDRAIDEYRTAAKALPDYSETQWQLGTLYEAYGDVQKARESFSRFAELDPARRSDADPHLTSLDGRRAVYDANVAEAEDILSDLLLPSLGLNSLGTKHRTKLTYREWRWASKQYKETTRATEKLSGPYVERELNHARENLESATTLFPLGAEANELLALINLQGNNWPDAYRDYDAVASQGFPVSFYAQVYSSRDSKVIRATKVEVGTAAVRLVYLSAWNTKKQISVPPSKPAGEDQLGNLVISVDEPPDTQAEAVTIGAAELKGIETDKNFVVLKRQSDRLYIAPLNMLAETPFEGGASRTFGNEYTRLFVRYLGYEQAKLGKEGMTTGEKFKLGFEIARIGVSVGMMGVGAPAAYGSAMRLARFAHALAVYREVGRGVHIANRAEAATRLVDDLQMDTTTLERDASDQRRAIEGIGFKVIPVEPLGLKFRDKL